MIYDCFTFFNELDLLELRLETLAHVVDYFVIVEADKTHAAAAKPFFFEENKNRFSKYLPKIIYAKPIDLSFPKPIIDNQEKYFHLIFPVTEEYLRRTRVKRFVFRVWCGFYCFCEKVIPEHTKHQISKILYKLRGLERK